MIAKHTGAAKMWLLNLLGNAALVAAVYFWLLLPDAHGWQVAMSGGLALVVLFCGLWLRAGSFAYFRVSGFRDAGAVWRAFRHSLRHLIALAIWALPRWNGISGRCAATLRNSACGSGKNRRRSCTSAARARCITLPTGCCVSIWILCPSSGCQSRALFPPPACAPRMLRSLRVLKRLRYWLWFLALLLIGAYLPYRLVWWIPDLSDLRKQSWSMGLRFALAYVLISAWVALLMVTGEHVEKEIPKASVTESDLNSLSNEARA